MQRAGLAAGAALAAALDVRGLLGEARAASSATVSDTFLGLAAFILPGSDRYSVAQGESAPRAGAVDTGALEAFVATLDEFIPISALGAVTAHVPASQGLATLLNRYALEVDPGAAVGPFRAPYANLSFKDKVAVYQRFESDPTMSGSELRFVSGTLAGLVALVFCSEAGHYDWRTRQLSGTPVAWQISGYAGPADGHAELKGYYRGRRSVASGSAGC